MSPEDSQSCTSHWDSKATMPWDDSKLCPEEKSCAGVTALGTPVSSAKVTHMSHHLPPLTHIALRVQVCTSALARKIRHNKYIFKERERNILQVYGVEGCWPKLQKKAQGQISCMQTSSSSNALQHFQVSTPIVTSSIQAPLCFRHTLISEKCQAVNQFCS